jgi:hypothetical protein
LIADLIKLGLDIRGTLTITPSPQDNTPRKVVFQGASNITANYWTKTGQPRKVRVYVIPADPKTDAQIARRDWLRAGVAIWQALSAEEKAAWTKAGEARQITGYNAFNSSHLKAYTPPSAAQWDGSDTTWDDNGSTFDA